MILNMGIGRPLVLDSGLCIKKGKDIIKAMSDCTMKLVRKNILGMVQATMEIGKYSGIIVFNSRSYA
jgi:hypothetical protein